MDKRKKKDRISKKGSSNENPDKLTKEEDAIARCVRFNCPTNTTMFEGNEVHYFVAKKAVDTLVESKKYGAGSKSKKFPDAKTAEYFLQSLLERGLFFRAKKTILKKKEKETTESSKKSHQDGGNKSPKIDKKEKEKVEEIGEKEEKNEGGNKEQVNDLFFYIRVELSPLITPNPLISPQSLQSPRYSFSKVVGFGVFRVDPFDINIKKYFLKKEEDKKRKKKIKLTFNDLQTFDIETNDVYVWVFDPTPFWKQCVGVLIVLGTIGGCLFPLWPDWLRLGVYYLSLTGIILFGIFLGFALVRTILFGIICVCSLGRHYLWILPNLLEEYVPGGFFGPKTETKKKDGANKKKKTNDDDDEVSEEKKPLLEPKVEPTDGEPVEATKENVDEQKQDPDDEKSVEEGEDDKEEESVTDESTSWDKLSENSQRSAEENGELQKND
uniref:Translocation protein SEC62 n=1 Tax=Meloidogyne floridensis TaxID=298350 RepID=A0A915NM18_9BILA